MLSYRTEGPIAWAKLDRPEKLNAMTRGFWADLPRVLDEAERDDAVRVLIFHGAGRCFSVGGVARGGAHVNLHWLKLMVLAGEILDAREAKLAGLVNRVTPAGGHLDAAAALAGRIAGKAPLALAVGKQVLNRRFDEGYQHAIDAVAYLQGSEDFAEGIQAFHDRRQPRFKGR